MIGIGHNGSPPLEEPAAAKLRWVKINIAEILEGIDSLTFEERGYYLTAMFKMYARMGGIPSDDREGAKVMRCDIRTFRRMRDEILSQGKFYTEDGLLKNTRVEYEISDYIREFKKRQSAALEREERKRQAVELQRTSGELPADFSETSGRLRGKVSEKSERSSADLAAKDEQKQRVQDHDATTTRPLTRTKNQNQNHKEEEEEYKSTPLPPKGGDDELGLGLAPKPAKISRRKVARECFAEWQAFAIAHDLTCPVDTSFDTHAKAIASRIGEHAKSQTRDAMVEVWRKALAHVARSKFLRGRETAFKADLGMVLRPKNFAKLISGGYGNGAHPAAVRWSLAPSERREPVKSEHEIAIEAMQQEARERSRVLREARESDG